MYMATPILVQHTQAKTHFLKDFFHFDDIWHWVHIERKGRLLRCLTI
jgi:hypothetical protein